MVVNWSSARAVVANNALAAAANFDGADEVRSAFATVAVTTVASADLNTESRTRFGFRSGDEKAGENHCCCDDEFFHEIW